MNGEFYNAAFNDVEKQAIIKTNVDNSNSQSKTYTVKYGSSKYANKYTHRYGSGESTTDNVFILSYTEYSTYLKDSDYRYCEPASYSGAEVGYKGHTSWWLRSTGDEQHHIAFVSEYGTDDSTYAYPGAKGVRPALWVDLDEAIDSIE